MKQSKGLWTAVLIAALAVALGCGGFLLWMRGTSAKVEQQLESAVPSSSSEEESSEEAQSVPETADPEDIPVDFEYLRGVNEDIYGWIELAATDQGYPVLSSTYDPDYYLHRDLNKNYAVAGSIYTQSTYNGTDFSDPCILIYGHHLRNGTMFGAIQSAIPDLDLENGEDPANYFTLYTPTSSLKCRICAAGPYGTDHVLFYHDFTSEADFERFFKELAAYPVGDHYASASFTPVFGDQIVVLSTCLADNYDHRYLIVAAVTEKNGVPLR